MKLTRRHVLLASGASVLTPLTLACGGGGSAEAPVASAEKTPVPPGGTLFPPRDVNPPRVPVLRSPDWLRTAGALFAPNTVTAGAAFLNLTARDEPHLGKRISSFRELPKLLDQARALGTDIVYLVDWYEGRHTGRKPADYWWAKGDYVPRADLGGADAFREGIEALHARGGRVVTYVEPFIIDRDTEAGKKWGERWSLRDASGAVLEEPYPHAYKLCPAKPGVIAHFVEVARRVVGEYGADGLFLDSYGFQRGWTCHGEPPALRDFDAGAKKLVAALREAVLAEKRDGVLLMEGDKLAALFEWVDASLDWGMHRVMIRPVHPLVGQIDLFTNGWSLDDMHQILAGGYKLALAPWYLEGPPGASAEAEVKRFVDAGIPRGEKMRLYLSQDVSRVIHAYRNAAILKGLPVPPVDEATPRRGQNDPAYATPEATEALMAQALEVARAVDDVLAGSTGLEAPGEHLRGHVETRTAVADLVDDPAVERKVLQQLDEALLWGFAKGDERLVTAVSVSNAALEARLEVGPKGPQRWEDLRTGEALEVRDGRLDIALAPHQLRWLRGRT